MFIMVKVWVYRKVLTICGIKQNCTIFLQSPILLWTEFSGWPNIFCYKITTKYYNVFWKIVALLKKNFFLFPLIQYILFKFLLRHPSCRCIETFELMNKFLMTLIWWRSIDRNYRHNMIDFDSIVVVEHVSGIIYVFIHFCDQGRQRQYCRTSCHYYWLSALWRRTVFGWRQLITCYQICDEVESTFPFG